MQGTETINENLANQVVTLKNQVSDLSNQISDLSNQVERLTKLVEFGCHRPTNSELVEKYNWTENDEKMLKIMVSQGNTPRGINSMFSWPEKEIVKKIEEMGLVQTFLMEIPSKEYMGRPLVPMSSNRGKRWTQDEDNWMTELVFSGFPVGAVSFLMGRTEYSIRCRIVTLGLMGKHD